MFFLVFAFWKPEVVIFVPEHRISRQKLRTYSNSKVWRSKPGPIYFNFYFLISSGPRPVLFFIGSLDYYRLC